MTSVAHDAGEVRAARLTDRQALAELSGQVHAASDAYKRSLGVPAPAGSPGIQLSTLIPSWIPLRPPSVHLVAESDGALIGSCRAITEPHRDDWVIIELDAADGPMAGEVRWALLEALIGEGAKRDVARYHVACADVRENVQLFGTAGFMAYAQEEILYRPAEEPGSGGRSWLRRGFRNRLPRRGAVAADITLQPAGAPDAWHLFDLWSHCTPPAIARVEDYRAADWESVGHEAIVPRSSLNPILHFSAVSAWLAPVDQRAGGFAQHGASRVGPHYLRFLVRDGTDGGALLNAVMGRLPADALAAGILAPVRTYESAGLQAGADAGFAPVGRVTLLVREVRATARQPAMVPAVN
ncbi:MAG TPA: hypothetical protein VGA91_01450 [Candidatus Limnocylindria bacterium]